MVNLPVFLQIVSNPISKKKGKKRLLIESMTKEINQTVPFLRAKKMTRISYFNLRIVIAFLFSHINKFMQKKTGLKVTVEKSWRTYIRSLCTIFMEELDFMTFQFKKHVFFNKCFFLYNSGGLQNFAL